MTSGGSDTVDELLRAWRAGDQAAMRTLMPRISDTLHKIAAREMARERRDHTLQATALVNEAYLRLVDSDLSWADRSHFLAAAAKVMRRVLVDHARARKREKRGGEAVMVTLHEAQLAAGTATPDVLDVDAVLERLTSIDPRKARIVELSFFGGLTYPEIAEAVGVSEATVARELRFAKAWLRKELTNRSP